MEKYQRNFQPCPICGEPKSTRAKTCAACAGRGKASLATKKLVVRTCKYCKATFRIPLWRERQGRGVYCSRECKDAYLTTLTGSRSIRWRGGTAGSRRGVGWQVARQWAIVRACGRCEKCGKETNGHNLTVHHIKPYRQCKNDMEANSPNNLIALCRVCHSRLDTLGRIERR